MTLSDKLGNSVTTTDGDPTAAGFDITGVKFVVVNP
jgi:hypothetical protein